MPTKTALNHCRIGFLICVAGFLLPGCDALNPDDPVALDFRGQWLLIAQHQVEPELNIRYVFSLTENDDHAFTASARQFLLEMPLWDDPVDVSGRILFNPLSIRLEFDYPESGLEPEVVTASYSRVRTDLSVVVVTGENYIGKAVGLGLPREGVVPYETDILTIEQIQ